MSLPRITQQYALFNPPPAMYSDEELEAWGELYCKLNLYARGALPFVRFMALPLAAKRRCLRATLNYPALAGAPPEEGKNPSREPRATPAGGVSGQITPAAGAGDPSNAR